MTARATTKSAKAAPDRAAFGASKVAPRVASYGRMSKDATGEMLGVERQNTENQKLAGRYDWTIPEALRFEDNDASAYSGKKRPGFESLLAGMARGEIDIIIAWHIDRLYRSLTDFARFAELAKKHNVMVKTVTAGDLDFGSPTGRAIAGILTMIAELESAHKGERQVLANVQRAAAGKWQVANRPFGYTIDGKPFGREAAAIRAAAVDILGGKPLKAVAREWNAAGLTGTRGKAFSSQTVRRVIMNPLYAGLKVHNGAVVAEAAAPAQGGWAPLIDPDAHRGIVALLSDPARVTTTSFEHKYMGAGLYRCGQCDDGTTMKSAPGAKRTDRPGQRPMGYTCRKYLHVFRQGPPVDRMVEQWVIDRLSAPDAHLMLEGAGVDLGELSLRREGLVRRKDTARRLWRAGSLEDAEYEEDVADLTRQIAACDSALADATRTSPAARLVTEAKDAEDVAARWSALSPSERRQVVDEIAVVTILPATRRGTVAFDPNDVRIVQRRGFS